MVEIREIGEEGLPRWVGVRRAVAPTQTGSVADFVDWARQAGQTVWLLATVDKQDAGTGHAIGDWHAPPGVAHAAVHVLEEHRRRGIGAAVLDALGTWARDAGYRELQGSVREGDETSLAWAKGRGFSEVGRESRLALELEAVEAPAVDPPAGIHVVSWAERPELARAMYEVACEAYPDVPGQEDDAMAPFEEWLSGDMQGTSDRPEAIFVAMSGDEVVGYGKLALSNSRPHVALHDIIGVRRAWRGRGIAGALKRAEIAWAKRAGFERLETMNEERNEPIRRLNQRHGYRIEPGEVSIRGPVSGGL